MEEDIKYLKSQEAYEMYFRGNPRLEKIVNRFIDKIKGLEEENSMLKKVNNITENITVEEVENAIKEASKEYIPTALIKEKIEELNRKEKEELKGSKGQDRYFIKQMYQYQRKSLEELLNTKM